MSPARAHRERILSEARAASTIAAPAGVESASEYELLLAALGVDLRTLKEIESVERKIEAKRAMLPRYLPWLTGVLAAGNQGKAQPDEIVTTLLIWAIDLADWDLALVLAGHVLKFGLELPERYKRKAPTLIVEEVADAALVRKLDVPLAILQAVDAMTADADIFDQVRAKIKKAIGLAFAAQAETYDESADTAVAGGKLALIDAALEALDRATALDASSGVKKRIEQLRVQRKALVPAQD